MDKLKAIADSAEMIVNGYAFVKDGENIKVVNLNNSQKDMYMDCMGNVLETSMDDIEIDIVLSYYSRNKKFLNIEWD